MDSGYTVAIWIEPPADVWPTRAPVQVQRDFAKRVAACTWGKFAYALIPWATEEYVVYGRSEHAGAEVVVGDRSGEQVVDDLGGIVAAAATARPCVVCERSASLRLFVREESCVSLCGRCVRSKTAILATVRAMQRERVALSVARR